MLYAIELLNAIELFHSDSARSSCLNLQMLSLIAIVYSIPQNPEAATKAAQDSRVFDTGAMESMQLSLSI